MAINTVGPANKKAGTRTGMAPPPSKKEFGSKTEYAPLSKTGIKIIGHKK